MFIWKGSQAGVRKKFISARAAQNLRFEDMAYNTIAIDSGEDPKLEQEMMKLVKSSKITSGLFVLSLRNASAPSLAVLVTLMLSFEIRSLRS